MRIRPSANLTIWKGVCREGEAHFDRPDRGGLEASGVGDACGGHHPSGQDIRADHLPLDEVVRGPSAGSGSRDQAASRPERTAQEAGSRIKPGQGHFARRCLRKLARPALKWTVVDYIASH